MSSRIFEDVVVECILYESNEKGFTVWSYETQKDI